MESGRLDPLSLAPGHLPRLPKTIDLTVDYLRSGLPRGSPTADAGARGRAREPGQNAPRPVSTAGMVRAMIETSLHSDQFSM